MEPDTSIVKTPAEPDDTPTGKLKGLPRRWLTEKQMDDFEKWYVALMDRATESDTSDEYEDDEEDSVGRSLPRRKLPQKKAVEVSYLAACREAGVPYSLFELEKEANPYFKRRLAALDNLMGDRIEGQFNGYALSGDKKFIMAATLGRRAAKERLMLRKNEFSVTSTTTVRRPIPEDTVEPAEGIPAIQSAQANAMLRIAGMDPNAVDSDGIPQIVETEAHEVQGD